MGQGRKRDDVISTFLSKKERKERKKGRRKEGKQERREGKERKGRKLRRTVKYCERGKANLKLKE